MSTVKITEKDLIEEYKNRYSSKLFTEESKEEIKLRLINDFEIE